MMVCPLNPGALHEPPFFQGKQILFFFSPLLTEMLSFLVTTRSFFCVSGFHRSLVTFLPHNSRSFLGLNCTLLLFFFHSPVVFGVGGTRLCLLSCLFDLTFLEHCVSSQPHTGRPLGPHVVLFCFKQGPRKVMRVSANAWSY